MMDFGDAYKQMSWTYQLSEVANCSANCYLISPRSFCNHNLTVSIKTITTGVPVPVPLNALDTSQPISANS